MEEAKVVPSAKEPSPFAVNPNMDDRPVIADPTTRLWADMAELNKRDASLVAFLTKAKLLHALPGNSEKAEKA